MALSNFIKAGSYTRISQISVQKESERVDFEINVYESKTGKKMFGPLFFGLGHSEELNRYNKENLILPPGPDYPALCASREAMTPMWTEDSTPEERAEYDQAKAAYDQAIETHQADCAAIVSEVETAAGTENEYSKYFSDENLYQGKNATECAYNYLKTQPGFEGVVDA